MKGMINTENANEGMMEEGLSMRFSVSSVRGPGKVHGRQIHTWIGVLQMQRSSLS